MSDSIKLTILKLNELQNKLNSIKPFKRPKRGLIDGLGTAVKFITGNMDAQDAQNLNSQIEKLKADQFNTEVTIEKQHNLNVQMIQRFRNLTLHINNEQNIKSYLNKISNSIRKEEDILQEIQ